MMSAKQSRLAAVSICNGHSRQIEFQTRAQYEDGISTHLIMQQVEIRPVDSIKPAQILLILLHSDFKIGFFGLFRVAGRGYMSPPHR